MDINSILKLKELIVPEEEEREIVHNPNKGSVFNPGDIGDKNKKDLAKPYAKIEAKIGPKAIDPKIEPTKKKNEIWSIDEVKDIPISKNETRPKPKFEVLFKQNVATEDVFLGMSDLDPSSTKCQLLLMKIFLPETKYPEISLDVTSTVVSLQAPKFYLYHILPYKVNEKEGKAKWISDKEILTIELPIIREDF